MSTARSTPDAAEAAQRLADEVARAMYQDDAAAQALGMRIEAVAPGAATVSMVVAPGMLNGFRICHGGYITTLADTAFAYACNSYDEVTVASGIVVDFLAPAAEGERLVAEARELSRAGRTGVYDITVRDPAGRIVAVMRGRSHTIKGRHIVRRPEGQAGAAHASRPQR